MLLSLEDKAIQVRLSSISGGRTRLVLDYPDGNKYRDRIMTALAELLRSPADIPKRRGRPCKTGVSPRHTEAQQS